MIEPRHRLIPLSSGVELHVLEWLPTNEPSDTPFLLTHGLASNARLWDGVAWRLAERGHRVIAVDQRGHGRSSKPDGPYDVTTCADDLALLIDSVGFELPPLVAGQSWGGNVVLELGFRHPDSVRLVACVDGGFIDLQERFESWEACATALAPPRLAGTPITTMQGWLGRSAADWPPEGRDGTMENFERRDDGTIAPWLSYDRHLEVLRGLWEHRPTERFPAMSVPVLMIPADNGEVAWTSSKDAAVRAAIDALPVGRAHWFRPAHHDVHAQQPDAVAVLLDDAVTDPLFFSRT